MKINLQNNYNGLKSEFKVDTGLDANSNVAEYIAYYHARMMDNLFQVSFRSAQHFYNTFENLPDKLANRIGDKLRSIQR